MAKYKLYFTILSCIGGGLFARKHRRSPSHFNLKYGRENSPPDSPVKEPPYGSNATSSAAAAAAAAAAVVDFNDSKDGWEVRIQLNILKNNTLIKSTYSAIDRNVVVILYYLFVFNK